MADSPPERVDALLSWMRCYSGNDDDTLEAFADGAVFGTLLEEFLGVDAPSGDEDQMSVACDSITAFLGTHGVQSELDAQRAQSGDEGALRDVMSALFAACIQSDNKDEVLNDVMSMPEEQQAELMTACAPYMPDGLGDSDDGGDDSDVSFDGAGSQAGSDGAPGGDADDDVVDADRAAMAAELERASASVAAAITRAETAEAELAGAREALASYERHHAEDDDQVNAHMEAAAAAATQLERKERELEETRESVRALQADAAQMREDAEEASRLRDEVDVLRSQAAKAEQARRDAATLREQLEATRRAAAGAEELRKRNEELTKKTIELEREAAKLPSLREQLSHAKDQECSLQFKKEQAETSATDAEARAKDLQATMTELHDANRRLSAELAAMRAAEGGGSAAGPVAGVGVREFDPEQEERIARLEAQKAQLQATLESSGEEAVSRLAAELDSVKRMREIYKTNLGEAKAEAARLGAELEATASSLEAEKAEKERLAGHLTDARGRLEDAASDIAERTQTAEQLRSRLEDREARITSLQAELEEAKAAASRAAADATAAVEAAEARAEEAISVAHSQADAAVEEAAAAEESTQQDAAVKIAQAEEDARQRVAEAEAAAASAAAKARSEAEARVAEAEGRNLDLQRELGALKESHAAATAEHDKAAAALEQARQELQTRWEAAAEKEARASEALAALRRQVAELEADLEEERRKHARARKEARANKAKAQSRARMAQPDERVEALEALCERLRMDKVAAEQREARMQEAFEAAGMSVDLLAEGRPIGPLPPGAEGAPAAAAGAPAHAHASAAPRRVAKRSMAATALDSADMAESMGAAMSMAHARLATAADKNSAAQTEILTLRAALAAKQKELEERNERNEELRNGLQYLALRQERAVHFISESDSALDMARLQQVMLRGLSAQPDEVRALITRPSAGLSAEAAAPEAAASAGDDDGGVKVEVEPPARPRRVTRAVSARTAATAAPAKAAVAAASAGGEADDSDADEEFLPPSQALGKPEKPCRRALKSASTNKRTQRTSIYNKKRPRARRMSKTAAAADDV